VIQQELRNKIKKKIESQILFGFIISVDRQREKLNDQNHIYTTVAIYYTNTQKGKLYIFFLDRLLDTHTHENQIISLMGKKQKSETSGRA